MVIGWTDTQLGCMARPSEGGSTRGGQRSVLKPLLWGEPPAFGGVGGTLPPRLSPGGGNGKGGVHPPCCRTPSHTRYARSRPPRDRPRKSLQPLESRNSHIWSGRR